MYAAGFTDIGQVRNQNQDAVFVSTAPVGPLPNLFVVADGMGGHKAGDIASSRAVPLFCDYFVQRADMAVPDSFLDMMVDAAQHVNGILYELAQGDPALQGMGTTFTACVIVPGRADIVHVGDSRAYGLAPGHIAQLTLDHTYAEEMVRAGEMTPEKALTHEKRHALTRVLAYESRVQMDAYPIGLEDPKFSALLLCTDGLTNMLSNSDILDIVSREGYVEYRARTLIDEANRRGGHDNISAVLIHL